MILTTRDLRDLQQEAGRLIRPDYDLGMLRVRYRVEANRLHPGDPEDVQNGHLGNLLAYLLAYCEREGLDAADALAARLAAARQESEAQATSQEAELIRRAESAFPYCATCGALTHYASWKEDVQRLVYACPNGHYTAGNGEAWSPSAPTGPLLWDGRPADDPERADAEEPILADKRGPFDLVAHLQRQRAFSLETFGPGPRTGGVIDHIRKELREVEAEPADLEEWIDIALLAFDGAWRHGHEPAEIAAALEAKQARNEARDWPDWRTLPRDRAIEHTRNAEEPVSSPEERLPSAEEVLADLHLPPPVWAPHGTPPGRLPAAPLALHSLPVFTPEEIAAGALERLGPDAPPYVAIRRETVLSDADERDHRTVWERTQSAAVPGVWVAPAAGADLTPTAGMELEREIADAVEAERREGLDADQVIQARWEGRP